MLIKHAEHGQGLGIGSAMYPLGPFPRPRHMLLIRRSALSMQVLLHTFLFSQKAA